MISLKKIFSVARKNKNSQAKVGAQKSDPIVIPHSQHSISHSQIDPHALTILYRLKDAGFDGYLVGGCVRDLLLGHEPKDFDVTTNASPEDVHKLFKKSRLIGRRFKLVHVGFGRNAIEVATFRAPPEADQHIDGRIMRDNVFGTLEQDAWRRDFTINALYYDISDFSIIDYTGGITDLEAGKIRLIGDAQTRYREDPVRMLRALRFVGKLGLRLDDNTERFIPQLASLLADIPAARLFDELLKLYLTGNAAVIHELLCHYGLFEVLFPQTAALLHTEQDNYPRTLIIKALESTDIRIDDDKPVTPAFLFAALMWEPVRQLWQQYKDRNIPPIPALQRAVTEVVSKQASRVAAPKRFILMARDIWTLQIKLEQRFGKKAYRTLTHPKFRAAYDFLLLRVQAGEPLSELADWWTVFQDVDGSQQQKMINSLASTGSAGPRKRHRRRKKPVAASE